MLEFWHNGEWHEVAACGFSSLIREEKNLTDHSLIFSLNVTISEPLFYKTGDLVALRNKGVIEFVGNIREKTRTGKAVTFVAKNVWWFFENITHEVDWDFVATAYSASHVTLCRDENGDEHTAGWQIQKAIERAASQGTPVLFNPADLNLINVMLPVDEVYDLSCAEVIQKMMRWYPNTSIIFEYPDDPKGKTTIRFIREDSLNAIDLSVLEIQNVTVSETENLISGVKIVYEVTSAIVNGETTEIIEDKAGAQSGPGVLVITKDVHDGSYVESKDWTITDTMNLQTAEIPANWYDNWAWVQSHSWFNTESVCWVTSASPVSPPFSRYVVGGWKDGFDVTSQLVRFDFSYRYVPIFWATCYEHYSNNGVSFTLRLTNAETGVYYKTSSGTDHNVVPGEAMPTGVANQLLLAQTSQKYRGSCGMHDPADRLKGCGSQVLNIKGGEADWEAMCALIQTFQKNYMDDMVQISFGRGQHLSPDDFINFLTMGRQIRRPNRDR